MDDLECDKLEGVDSHRDDKEMEIIEADEYGWSVVYKDNIFYHKKTTRRDNVTVNLYVPAFKYDEKQKYKKGRYTYGKSFKV